MVLNKIQSILNDLANSIVLSNYISIDILTILPFISLIIIGYAVEKNYVSRTSIFANSVSLCTYSVIVNANYLLILYTHFGFILGIIGIISYIFNYSLSTTYYNIGVLYNSFISGFVLIFISPII